MSLISYAQTNVESQETIIQSIYNEASLQILMTKNREEDLEQNNHHQSRMSLRSVSTGTTNSRGTTTG